MSPRAALYLVWLAWALSWWAAAGWSARSTHTLPLRAEMGYRLLLIAGMLLLFYSPGWMPERLRMPLWRPNPAVQWGWVGLALLGFSVCWWARLHLGRLWSAAVTRKEGHRVIDSGPYALVRHPIYTGVLIAEFATWLQHSTMAALAGFLLTVIAWYWKARLEEDILRAELGPAYGAYAARVPMLLPFGRR